ncbi:hypothetical protein T01_13117 [Trichinella spiralis]|uniref:Uncharacterized protein n=1 Tax=Trichinella spiralis TaxID=6334 RepID=A0A0V1B2U3_TRISP|nr:hypothetical protein T01_13117 [Trichinella spiralis]
MNNSNIVIHEVSRTVSLGVTTLSVICGSEAEPFHRTSLGCVFNRYGDDGLRFIAARWEMTQCEVIAALHVENKVLRLRKSFGLQRWSCAAENKQVPGNGRGIRCNLEQLIADAEISTSNSAEIVTHHSIHWHGSGKWIDTWNLASPCDFFNAAVERPTCGNLTGFKIPILM